MSTRSNNLPIWNFFDKSRDGRKTATCIYCHRDFSFKTSVTNLKQHLKFKHISAYNNLRNYGKTFEPTSVRVSQEDEPQQAGTQRVGSSSPALPPRTQRILTCAICSREEILIQEDEPQEQAATQREGACSPLLRRKRQSQTCAICSREEIPLQADEPQKQAVKQWEGPSSAPLPRRTQPGRRRRTPHMTKETARTTLVEYSKRSFLLAKKNSKIMQQILGVLNRIADKMDRHMREMNDVGSSSSSSII